MSRRTVCVQGLGFVGSAMALAVASARDLDGKPCFSVVGLDLDTPLGLERIEKINAGVFPFPTGDSKLSLAAQEARAAGNLLATADPHCLSRADVVVVDIHLDVLNTSKEAQVDFGHFIQAIRTIGESIQPNTLIIVETTVPPGTCGRVVAPELAAIFEKRGLLPNSFLLAHSYERVMPGNDYFDSIKNFWRVYAGHTPEAADACAGFLSTVINVRDYPLTRLKSTTASEIAKVLENSYRAVNIAFIEEWARFGEAVGVDMFELIEAIRIRPTHNNIRQPGFGVGGYCLTKDPLFGGVAARQVFERSDLRFPFCELAIETNRRMPLVSVEQLQKLLGGSLRSKRILLLGVAYKQDVGDCRYSPALTFVNEVMKRDAVVVVSDPLVTDWPEAELVVHPQPPPAHDFDAIVFAVAHEAYSSFDFLAWLEESRPAILDANAVLSPQQRISLIEAGCAFGAVGEGR